MAQQSRLENIGITKRDELEQINDYSEVQGNEYSETHPDALSDGDEKGKGTGVSMGYAIADTNSFNVSSTGVITQQMSYGNLITRENGNTTIGGKYDINGTVGVAGAFQGNAGRNFISQINKYNASNEYGVNSVDTSINIQAGQYTVD